MKYLEILQGAQDTKKCCKAETTWGSEVLQSDFGTLSLRRKTSLGFISDKLRRIAMTSAVRPS